MKFQISRSSRVWKRTSLSPHKKASKKGEDWFVEINSLEELLSLAEDEGELIISISAKIANLNEPQIEIYDDYRE